MIEPDSAESDRIRDSRKCESWKGLATVSGFLFSEEEEEEEGEDVGLRGQVLLGKEIGRRREGWRGSGGVRMDVKSREALEELRSALRLSGMEFPGLPLAIPQYVSVRVSTFSCLLLACSVWFEQFVAEAMPSRYCWPMCLPEDPSVQDASRTVWGKLGILVLSVDDCQAFPVALDYFRKILWT